MNKKKRLIVVSIAAVVATVIVGIALMWPYGTCPVGDPISLRDTMAPYIPCDSTEFGVIIVNNYDEPVWFEIEFQSEETIVDEWTTESVGAVVYSEWLVPGGVAVRIRDMLGAPLVNVHIHFEFEYHPTEVFVDYNAWSAGAFTGVDILGLEMDSSGQVWAIISNDPFIQLPMDGL